MGKLVDLKSARLRRWEKKQAPYGFKPVADEQLVWKCSCGCWQYELRPVGVFCVSCGSKQSVSIKV